MPRRDLSIEEKDLEFSLRCPHLEKRREHACGGDTGVEAGAKNHKGVCFPTLLQQSKRAQHHRPGTEYFLVNEN